MMNQIDQFKKEKDERIRSYETDKNMQSISHEWVKESFKKKYVYNFQWLGRPIIQFPADIIAMQEIIWDVKPDLIVETGIAHGGSLVFYASMMELLGGSRMVLGIDIDIREHNRIEIEMHPLFKRIKLIEGSSIDDKIFELVKEYSTIFKNILVVLDSNHTHEHVFKELNLYSRLVSVNSYLVVFDTVVENLPAELFQDRPWHQGNSPKSALMEFLSNNDNYIIDKNISNKLLATAAPDGFLKRLK